MKPDRFLGIYTPRRVVWLTAQDKAAIGVVVAFVYCLVAVATGHL